MFYTQGNPVALLVDLAKPKSTPRRFPDPQAALAWCIKHRVRFVYLPSDLSGN
jgi:hypothetical protein